MITIKTLLFKLLDEIEPNELLELKINKQYNNIYVANKQSILPLAVDMRYHSNDVDELELAYRESYAYREVDEYELEYVMDHIVLLNERKYVVTEELTDLQYFDDYFSVTMATPEGISTCYYKYSDISSIRRIHEASRKAVKEYNSLNYKYKSNK